MAYSDMFTYESRAFDGANVSYSNATLLKDLCGKKAGVTLDEIRLDTRTGKFTVPRFKVSTRATTAMETAAKTLVEFKGKHTRFTDAEDSTTVEDNVSWLGNEGFVLPTVHQAVVTLKIYENKRKLYKPDSTLDKYVLDSVTKAVNGTLIENSTGSRGELLVKLAASDEIPMKTLFEFTSGTRKFYYSRVV